MGKVGQSPILTVCYIKSRDQGMLNLVPRVSHLTAPGSSRERRCEAKRIAANKKETLQTKADAATRKRTPEVKKTSAVNKRRMLQIKETLLTKQEHYKVNNKKLMTLQIKKEHIVRIRLKGLGKFISRLSTAKGVSNVFSRAVRRVLLGLWLTTTHCGEMLSWLQVNNSSKR